ncbi:MAG: hemolysin family protein [Bacillota bacterium]|nr:hemolysin family protein [Bacillota bacterium]
MDSHSISQIIFNLVIVLLLVFINGFFVAAEFSMVKVRGSRITQLINEGNKKAVIVQKITMKLDSYLSACQFGITLASLGLGWIGEPAVADAIKPVFSYFNLPIGTTNTIAFAIGFALITMLHIILGELAPKSISIQRTEAMALWIAYPLMGFYKITYPFNWVLNRISIQILKLVGLKPLSESEQAHSEEEIRILVSESQKSGLIDKTESVLFDNVFDFSDRVAREAMVPRTSAIILYTDDSYDENLNKIKSTRHTRFPVADGDKDNIIGFVHVTDFFADLNSKDKMDLKNIIRKILKVPESMELSNVLRLMKKNRILIAIVVDEFGGTAGLITLEDIVEEIVGEIQDEFDNERLYVEEMENGYSVDGRLLIEDLNSQIGTDISNEEVDTLGGWIHISLEDAVPEVGKKIIYENYKFEIAEMERNRISRVLVTKE